VTRRTALTFIDVSYLRVVVGSLDALLGMMNDGLVPAAWVWLDDEQPGSRYRVLTANDWLELRSLDLADREAALDGLPPTIEITIGKSSTPKNRAVVMDADGKIRGAWVPRERHGERHEQQQQERDEQQQQQPVSPDSSQEPDGYDWRESWYRDERSAARPEDDLDEARVGTGGGFRVGARPDDPGSPEPAEPDRGSPSVPTSAAGHPTLRRTPHLDVPPTIPTAPETEFGVSVYTDDQPFDHDEAGADVTVEAPQEVKRVRLTVTLITSEHFVVRGTPSRSFDIARDKVRSRPVTFTLQVAKRPPSTPAVITALFSYGGRVCGTVARQWAWDPAQPIRQSLLPETPPAPATLTVFTGAPTADLSVFVTASGDGLHYTSIVRTNLVPEYARPSPGPWNLPELAATLVTSKLNDVIDSKTSPDQRLAALESSGYEFWDAAPENFKDAFWKIIDSGRPLKSIYIASAEPSIPWELMTPFRPGQRPPLEVPPLGVSYAIGRWCRNTANLTAAPPSLPIRDAFVVVPRYRTFDALDARAEVNVIRGRMRGRRLRSASGQTFDRYFLRHQASLLHFVCHGASGVNHDDVLYLDEDEMLSSASLRRNKGLKAMCRARAPLIFINACSTGQRVPGLIGGAGFPLAFGDIGARAIIAPLWPVDSATASKIAVELYERALQSNSPPVAEILRTMRSRAYAEQNADSYAAYAFFGDPTARLELVS
jgi:hypothetical protein